MRRVEYFMPEASVSGQWTRLYYFTRDVETGVFYRLSSDIEVKERDLKTWAYRLRVVRAFNRPEILPGESLWLTEDREVLVANSFMPYDDPNPRHVYA